jgi:hypothetical protein
MVISGGGLYWPYKCCVDIQYIRNIYGNNLLKYLIPESVLFVYVLDIYDIISRKLIIILHT